MNKKVLANTGIIGAIIASIIFVEGEQSDDPYDPGGQTKQGITENTAREYGYTGDMVNLTKDEAIVIYKTLYVFEPHFDLLIPYSPAIAHKLIDAGVNVGTARVSIQFQKALNKFSRDGLDYQKVKEDGVIGTNTIAAYRALETKRGKETACTLILKALDSYQTVYYLSLDRHSRYTVGQVDKRIGNISLDQCISYNLTIPLVPTPNENK